MKKQLIFIFRYFLFWLVYFLFVKTFFIISNASYLKQVPLSLLPQIYWYGMRLDISAATYVLVVPYLLMLVLQFFDIPQWKKILKGYTYFLLVIFSFLVIVDAELYSYWGFRLDLTPLQYINTPGAMLASVSGWIVIKQLILGSLMVILFIWLYRSMVGSINMIQTQNWGYRFILFLIFGTLIIPIRGGLGLAPLNTGSAYFSNNTFANHAAINVVWNVGFASLQTETRKIPIG